MGLFDFARKALRVWDVGSKMWQGVKREFGSKGAGSTQGKVNLALDAARLGLKSDLAKKLFGADLADRLVAGTEVARGGRVFVDRSSDLENRQNLVDRAIGGGRVVVPQAPRVTSAERVAASRVAQATAARAAGTRVLAQASAARAAGARALAQASDIRGASARAAQQLGAQFMGGGDDEGAAGDRGFEPRM